jgi:hypothetical protein
MGNCKVLSFNRVSVWERVIERAKERERKSVREKRERERERERPGLLLVMQLTI